MIMSGVHGCINKETKEFEFNLKTSFCFFWNVPLELEPFIKKGTIVTVQCKGLNKEDKVLVLNLHDDNAVSFKVKKSVISLQSNDRL